jgi:hypothetical protein
MVCLSVGLPACSGSGVDRYAADLTTVSSGFIARLDFGELAQWGRYYQTLLALALLVLRVLTDHANDPLAVDHLALVANWFY